ncbi:T-cell surface glycoprotein CD5 [Xyrauchen texanus]|uniref:T-cell surface glycoprotein CD5 n=1 Tax=Xyrauchen texanus TaxID=154827 RepID=UPI002241FDD4|nr:T-cell surface glycoprotein CD5 [Xyrauchen texanus]
MGRRNEDSHTSAYFLLLNFSCHFALHICSFQPQPSTNLYQMENSLLLTLMVLLLLGVREGITSSTAENRSQTISIPTTLNLTAANTSCAQPTPCKNITQFITLPPVLALLKVYWKQDSPCEGDLYLFSQMHVLPMCFTNHMEIKWWNELCKDRRCGVWQGFRPTRETKGYLLMSNMTVSKASCSGLLITCQVLSAASGTELAAYKAVTGILIFLILSVILLQFSRPTYKAIRKRFSQKRQNQWIGPTQSQSVSYHRGQAGSNPNNNTLKRQSFPGLERLTVNPSREPSSNRNSDYDSYGYN